MGDVARFVVAEAQNPTGRGVLQRLLTQLEEGLKDGPEQVKELVVVSFLENLTGEAVALEALKPLMGPNLKREMEGICGQ
jgi:hypothetical protein